MAGAFPFLCDEGDKLTVTIILLDIYKVGYLWSFYHNAKVELSERLSEAGIEPSVGSVGGSMYDSYAAVDHQLFKKAAIKLGYNWVKIDMYSSRSCWSGSIDWRYGGPVAYVNFEFWFAASWFVVKPLAGIAPSSGAFIMVR
jgi:hypothetical protein